jgi:hypothetical protein
MPFPLPLDTKYRKEIVWAWIGDISDRIDHDLSGAETSWGIAQEIYLSLPPGSGDEEIESALWQARVKIDKFLHATNENHL